MSRVERIASRCLEVIGGEVSTTSPAMNSGEDANSAAGTCVAAAGSVQLLVVPFVSFADGDS